MYHERSILPVCASHHTHARAHTLALCMHVYDSPHADPDMAELQNDYGEDLEFHFGETPKEQNDGDADRKDVDKEAKADGATSKGVSKQVNAGDSASENLSISDLLDGYDDDDYSDSPEGRKDDNTAESSANVDRNEYKNADAAAHVDPDKAAVIGDDNDDITDDYNTAESITDIAK